MNNLLDGVVKNKEIPTAWLILRPQRNGSISQEIVPSPLTDATYMDEGDEAWPLYLKPDNDREPEGIAQINPHPDVSAAAKWRQQTGYTGRGGVIILWAGDVQSWCNQLRDPGRWRPGCIAVDEKGNRWEATGGTTYDGAIRWEPIK